MNEFDLAIAKAVEGVDEEFRKRHTSGKGVRDKWRQIIAGAVRGYVLDSGAVSSFDIAESLSQLPEDLRGGWLKYPHCAQDVSEFTMASKNPYIVEGKVNSMSLSEAASRVIGVRANEYVFSFPQGRRPAISRNTDLFYKSHEDVRDYFSHRFMEPRVTARFSVAP